MNFYKLPSKYIFIQSLLRFTYRWNVFKFPLFFCYNLNSLRYARKKLHIISNTLDRFCSNLALK